MNVFFKLLIGIFLLVSCTSSGQLNRISHDFGLEPRRILWLQIAGLTDEYLSLLKLRKRSIDQKIGVERFHCLGKMWNFSISKLRLNSRTGFLAQMSGRLDLNNTCEDYQKRPWWKIPRRSPYKIGFFSDKLLDRGCKTEKSFFYSNSIRWYMAEREGGRFFHADEKKSFENNKTYFDRSCHGGKCFTSFDKNILSTWDIFQKKSIFSLYIAQIYEFEDFVKKGDKEGITLFLERLDSFIQNILKRFENDPDALLVISSAGGKGVEIPKSGKTWEKKPLLFKRSMTQSIVLAYGAGSENFCGYFHEKEMGLRFIGEVD